MTLPGEAKQNTSSSASGQMPGQDTRVVGESEISTMDTVTHQSPEALSKLGSSRFEQFLRYGILEDLEDVIELFCQAVTLTPDGHPNLPEWLTDLGSAYHSRVQHRGDLQDLEKSIKHISRALSMTPDDHPHKPYRLATLTGTYTSQYKHLGKLDDLEKAIEYASRALTLAPDGHPHRPLCLAYLSMDYTIRFRRLGELDDLKKAIDYGSRALELTPDGHPDLANRYTGLAVAYSHQFKSLRDPDDLEKTIGYASHALELTPDSHPEKSRRLTDLSVTYIDRFGLMGELDDIQKAIDYGSRALELTPDGHPQMSHRLGDLAVAYTNRFQRLKELEDLEKSIELQSRAVVLTPEGHPDLPARHFNHAIYFLYLYDHMHQSDPSHLSTSLDSFRTASQLLTEAPREKFRYALHWADFASELSLLNPMEAYQTTIDLLPQFIWLGATANQRYQDLSMAENLAVNACFAAIQSANYSLALEWLEHARCVVWTQSLALRLPLDQLHASHPDLATRLKSIANQLNSSSFDTRPILAVTSNLINPEQAGQQRRRLATEYNSLLAKTRQLPGFENFLQPMKAKGLMRAARGGPIVVINCHKNRCDALFILPGHEEITHLPLPNFTQDKAQKAHSVLVSSLKQKGLRQRDIRLRFRLQPDYEDGIKSVLKILWSNIVKPVLDHLGYLDDIPRGQLPHITWCPTGPLAFLPLHAAGDYSQTQSRIFNYVISSYIPTLSALSPSTPSSLNRDCRVLGVGQANTPGCIPLPGTIKELSHVRLHTNKAKYMQLIDNQATTTDVLDAMEHHDWVHLACHAHQDVSDPTTSGFYLHDGILDLTSINQRSFENKGLAFLSACQTATGDGKLPDEAIHLASGMLMAGYPSVIATMWSVGDNDAPLVADKVYAQLMKDGKIGNGEAGRALHYAVAALREKVGEKAFGSWVPYIHIGL
ncbi:hypothetical protein RSAG8_09054, partial [Rhizoctonia solani AG-8 WAC10335]